MDYDKRKRTKQCPDSDISDFDDSTQPTTTSNDTPTQHFLCFILVESKDENRQITSSSPFLIQKVIQSIAGEPENIKKHYTGRVSCSLRYPRKPMPRIHFVHRLFTT